MDNKIVEEKVWVGLDVSKATFDAAIYYPVTPGEAPRDIKTLPCKKFDNSKEGVEKFASWLHKQNKGYTDQLLKSEQDQDQEETTIKFSIGCVMEATGKYSTNLVLLLAEINSELIPIIEHATTIKDFKSSLKLRPKTDKLDAAAIARYGAERMPTSKADLPPEYLQLREASRMREHIRDLHTNARLRLQEIPNNSIAHPVQKLTVDLLKEQLEKCELLIAEHIRNFPELNRAVIRLTTIPGVGFYTAVTVLAELGPLNRFKRSRHATSFAGLAPEHRNSGTSVKGTRISKKGPGSVRQVLYMASLTAAKKQPQLYDLYSRLIGKGKSPMAARCAVMRKLLTIMHAVFVNKEDYQHDYQKKSKVKTTDEKCQKKVA